MVTMLYVQRSKAEAIRGLMAVEGANQARAWTSFAYIRHHLVYRHGKRYYSLDDIPLLRCPLKRNHGLMRTRGKGIGAATWEGEAPFLAGALDAVPDLETLRRFDLRLFRFG